MKKIFLMLVAFASQGWAQPEAEIANVLDSWHRAAANAETEKYFGAMTSDAVFIGTDATEVWKSRNAVEKMVEDARVTAQRRKVAKQYREYVQVRICNECLEICQEIISVD